ncbi:hypothetical protein [Baekduia sp. Peel2402]|uniref:hypothetical protein n=1 Tax=Baekduia sp. Peel2402 TaxID=3458296 RepID=UPI00403EB993
MIPVVAAFAFSRKQEAMYQGTASVLLNQQNLAAALSGLPQQSSSSNDAIREIETQASVARSINVAKLVTKADSSVDPDALLSNSSVAVARNADVLLFKAQDHDPSRAIDLANAYAQAFTAYRRQLDTRAVQTAKRGVVKRLQQLEDDNSRSRLRNTLEEKKEQLDTLEALQTANATVDNPARGAVKVAPKTKRNVALGLFVGIALAAFVAFALETRPRRSAGPLSAEHSTDEASRTEQLV